jgi:hypothetical protein
MFRASACFAFLLIACPQRPNSGEKAELPSEPTQSEVGRVIDLTAQAGSEASNPGTPRELQPREGHDSCVEMYTVCVSNDKGENCTSARLQIECGSTSEVPTTGEQLKCVCP